MSPRLTELLAWAKGHVAAMTPAEHEEMLRKQRESFVRSGRTELGETSMVLALPAAPGIDHRAILLSLIAGMYLCEGRGDVSEACWHALRLAGITPPSYVEDDSTLSEWLEREFNVQSIWTLKAPEKVS